MTAADLLLSTPADLLVSTPAPWEDYRARLVDGAIPFQHCRACGRSVFHPRVLCPHCGGVDLEWRTSSGAGEVYSQTYLPARDGGGHQVLLVDLAEGFRVMGVAAGEPLAIGDRVVGRSVPAGDPAGDPGFAFERSVG